MNFVQLLFELKIEDELFSKYTDSDFIKYEKRIKAERQINPEINSEIANKLLEIIKTQPKELEEFVKKKSLVNVFLGIEPKVNYNSLFAHPNFKTFFEKYLEDDLRYIFKRKVAKKEYASLESMMLYKPYFSFNFIYELQEIFENKLAYASDFYSQKAFIKHAEYDFLTNKSFFSFINHINNFTIENYLSNIYNTVVDEFNKTKQLRHPLHALIAYSFYRPEDDEFRDIVRQNKSFARERLKELTGSGKGFFKSFGTVAVVIFFIVRILLIVGRSSNSHSTQPDFKVLQKDYLKNISFNLNATLGYKEKNLINYIQDNELDKENGYKLVKNTKTGAIPFDIKLPNYNIDNFKTFTLVNDSKYDLIVLEYEMFRVNNLKNNNRTSLENVRFIKSKDSLKFSNYDDFDNTIFSFYLGKSLATYKNPFLNETKPLFKKDKITHESRFLHPIKGTKTILNTFYKLKNRTVISVNKNFLTVKSKNLQHNLNGLNVFTKRNILRTNLNKKVTN